MKGDTMRKACINNGAADAFALGIIYNGIVYMRIERVYNRVMQYAIYDKTSKKHGRLACLRFRPTAEQRKDLVNNWKVFALCTVEELDAKRLKGENRGHAFEKLARETLNGWTMDRRAWWEGADFIANGETYQAKLEGGTFCTAKQCKALRK